mgnify:CR=1 FL=1
MNIPLISTIHGSHLASSLLKKYYNSASVNADKIIAISDYVKNNILKNNPEKKDIIKVIHRGADIEMFNPENIPTSRIIQISEMLQLPDEAKIIMLPARPSSWKGHEILIKSFSSINNENIICIMPGADDDGHYVTNLRNLAKKYNVLGKKVLILGAGGVVSSIIFALKKMKEDNNWDSLAVQCWSQMQELYGIAPCLAYGWMGSEDGIAVSCEGDVQGSMSMLLLNYISNSDKSSTLLDLATFDKDADAVQMWHCGVSPRHFANEDGIKWVDHTTLGRKTEKKYGVAGDQVFAPQKTTTTYISNNGERILVLNSNIFEHSNKGFDGTRGWFKDIHLNRKKITSENLVNTLNMVGHEHHYAVGQGDYSKELIEFAAWNNLKLIEEIPLVDYLSPLEN